MESAADDQEERPLKRLCIRTGPDLRPGSGASESDDSDSDGDTEACGQTRKAKYKVLSHIINVGPAFPRSKYEGWIPPLKPMSELVALSELSEIYQRRHSFDYEPSEYVCLDLHDFEVYRPDGPKHPFELVTLDRLRNRDGHAELLFDGILSVGSERRFVQGVRFQVLSIDGYESQDFTSVQRDVWLQSKKAEASNVWYRLGRPAQEYQRFYEPFLWLVQFSRQFVDYLLDNSSVSLREFRWHFHY